MKLLMSAWMQELDSETIHEVGIPSIVLMENASRGAADFFARRFPLERGYRYVAVFAGKGNNGGDGLAVGRILSQKGYLVEFFLLTRPESLNPDPAINFNILRNLELPYTVVTDEERFGEIVDRLMRYNPRETFFIDAIFGSGLNKPVTGGIYGAVIDFLASCGYKVAAMDIPSGISDSFLPEEGVHVNADVTATFQCLKTAHLHPDGNKFCGEIAVIDIGIPLERTRREKYYIRLITPADFKDLLANREVDAHKGDFGHVLTVAGSREKPGAGILSAYSVLRSGAGLCTAAVCYENRLAPVIAHPELMTMVYDSPAQLTAAMEPFNTILMGPGLGDTEETLALVSEMLAKAKAPVILDADALNVLQRDMDLLGKTKAPLVLTPHPGEFSRLTGRPPMEIKQNRIALARDFAMKHNVYIVLKGHHSIIASPGGQVYVNPTGNPGMATAGSGDVLSGIIAGMMAQFNDIFSADFILQAAVFIHGHAGDLAVKETGQISLTAGDILSHIPQAVQNLKNNGYTSPFTFS